MECEEFSRARYAERDTIVSGIDLIPYRVFKDLRQKFPVEILQIRETDFSLVGNHLTYKSHRDYMDAKFRERGIEVYRWVHNYNSLQGSNPELGVVYLAGDSVIDENLEAHVLIGHNARYIGEAARIAV